MPADFWYFQSHLSMSCLRTCNINMNRQYVYSYWLGKESGTQRGGGRGGGNRATTCRSRKGVNISKEFVKFKWWWVKGKIYTIWEQINSNERWGIWKFESMFVMKSITGIHVQRYSIRWHIQFSAYAICRHVYAVSLV